MNEIFEKIYNDNNTSLNEDTALFEKVYTEAEMLNEMNPKLRALLAAGLIGTASLGAASCSMPTDDSYDAQYTIEQPTPENPEEIENSEDSEDSEEIGNNGGEETVTFESLGVEEYAESLARAEKDLNNGKALLYNKIPVIGTDYIYINGQFVDASDMDIEGDDNVDASELGNVIYICYADSDTYYYVPESMESDFDAAIATYNNAQ